jgi:tetrapyrrole methylase family protein/MazG family protein
MPPGITVVGLGPGDPELVTRRVWRVLETAGEIYVRTRHHPIVSALPSGLSFKTFDDLFERQGNLEHVLSSLAEALIELGKRDQGVVYGVPGDPYVGDATVDALRERANDAGTELTVLHGVSFVEPSLRLAQADGLPGLQVTDALGLVGRYHPPFPPDLPALIANLHDRETAGEVKRCLMNQYPPDHPTLLIGNPGTPDESTVPTPLSEIDTSDVLGPLTVLFVRPTPPNTSFESFQETVAHLRAPDGCPWDREQTHLSLRQHLLGEAYEALDALDRESVEDMAEELGDLMLQLVIQVQIAIDDSEFNMADVLSGINTKLIRRHPHVFGDLDVDSVSEVLHNWEALKEEERQTNGGDGGILDGVPSGYPALAQALEYQLRAARVGFDWPDIDGVLAKVVEEVREVEAEDGGDSQAAEIGDLFFALVNLARWLEIDPEAALRGANRRFKARFGRVEAGARRSGSRLSDLSIDQLESLWQQAKREEDA